jgi:hypothetical protein
LLPVELASIAHHDLNQSRDMMHNSRLHAPPGLK